MTEKTQTTAAAWTLETLAGEVGVSRTGDFLEAGYRRARKYNGAPRW